MAAYADKNEVMLACFSRSRRSCVRISEQEVRCLILGDLNVCSDLPLISVAIALNAQKTEHLQRVGINGAPSASNDISLRADGTTDEK